MTLPRKGTRKITVDGIEYRWLLSPNDSGLELAVECIEYPREKMGALIKYGNIVSPGLVRKAILYALSTGWQPQTQSKRNWFEIEGTRIDDNKNLGSELNVRV
jgi:hypothetical protein